MTNEEIKKVIHRCGHVFKDEMLQTVNHYDYEDNPDHWVPMDIKDLVNLCSLFYKLGTGERKI